MQFSTILVALLAGAALAAPAVDSPALEARQQVRTECVLCRKECFFNKGNNYNDCIANCNKTLRCQLTP